MPTGSCLFEWNESSDHGHGITLCNKPRGSAAAALVLQAIGRPHGRHVAPYPALLARIPRQAPGVVVGRTTYCFGVRSVDANCFQLFATWISMLLKMPRDKIQRVANLVGGHFARPPLYCIPIEVVNLQCSPNFSSGDVMSLTRCTCD